MIVAHPPLSFWGWLLAGVAGAVCAALAAVLILMVYFPGKWLVQYAFRSPEQAQRAALAEFYHVCRDEGLDPGRFTGPRLDYRDEDNDFYIYVWAMRGDSRQTVDVTVGYLPLHAGSSESRLLVSPRRASGARR